MSDIVLICPCGWTQATCQSAPEGWDRAIMTIRCTKCDESVRSLPPSSEVWTQV